MIINLHIDRLVLDGLPIKRHQGSLVKAAIESELGLLLAANGLSRDLSSSGARPSVATTPIHLTGNSSPRRLGEQIARVLHGGISK